LYGRGQFPTTEAMPWLTWRKSTQQLLDALDIL